MTCEICHRELRPGEALEVILQRKGELVARLRYLCRRKASPECFTAFLGDTARPEIGRTWRAV